MNQPLTETRVNTFFDQDENLLAIREGVRKVCQQFPDEYWRERDEDGKFPHEFHRAVAEGGWLGITMPEEFGGQNLGVSEAAMMMHTVGNGGGGMAAAEFLGHGNTQPTAVRHGSMEFVGKLAVLVALAPVLVWKLLADFSHALAYRQ